MDLLHAIKANIPIDHEDQHAIFFDPAEDHTRQEDRPKTDIRAIIRRHGGIPLGKALTSGEIDYDINLQTAIAMRNRANMSYNGLQKAVRNKYRNWEQVLLAIYKKELEIRDRKIQFPVEAQPSPKGDTPPIPPKTD